MQAHSLTQSTVWWWVEEMMWHKFWDMGMGECFVRRLIQLHLQVGYKSRTTKCFSWETSLVAKTIFDFACSYCRDIAVQSMCRTPNYIKHTCRHLVKAIDFVVCTSLHCNQ